MAETDNNPGGNVIDPLKMRNTETSALKRMPVSPNSASASSAARKTIKLKPLIPSSSSSDAPTSGSGSISRTVAPPSILLNRKPAAAKTEEPPKFMSTNTAPIAKMAASPRPEKPVLATDLNEIAETTKTVSIPRLQARMAPKPLDSMPKPSDPGSAATVVVPKIDRPSSVAAATVAVPKMNKPSPVPTTPATVSVPKISKAAPMSAPAFVSTATAPIAAALKPAQSSPITPEALGSVSTRTQGIQKQAIAQAKMQSGLQEAKPAIKLRPSASPTQEPESLSPNSPTIKLSPKTESAVSPVPAAETAEAEAPASNDITVTTKIPRKTLQLKPKMPQGAQNQAQLREQGDIANQKIKTGVEEGEQTIAQHAVEQTSKKAASSKKGSSASGKAQSEPSLIFTICAILAFLVIGFMVYALTAQFLNTWEQKNLPVIGFQQIYESMKK